MSSVICEVALRGALVAATTGVALASAMARPDQDPVRDALRSRIEILRTSGRLVVAGDPVHFTTAVAELYERSGFAPLWGSAAAAAFPAAVAGLAHDGLTPAHYRHGVPSPARGKTTVEDLAETDLARTDALLLALHDLRFGRTRRIPTSASQSVQEATGLSPDEVRHLARASDLAARFERLRPDHFVYGEMRHGLEALRRVSRSGGWQPVPPGTLLKIGQSDSRISLVRRRLEAEGYLARTDSEAELTFDSALDGAVRLFQHHHGLNEDGIVGPSTLAELNVTVDARIEQVRVNLERARWVLHELPDTVLIVNIAGARVYLLYGGGVAFDARAIVGKANTRTPVFTATLQYIQLNPAWNVPPGIVGEVLAAARRSRGYLTREGIRILDTRGRVVDPRTLDFSRYSAATFPYAFRQDPGPRNPLGRIKFGLPNRYNVYLHDTPARQLFEREDRTFSHGCVRVEDPVRLAELVLDDAVWDRQAIESAIVSGRTRSISLRHPMAVLIQYWTASADHDGRLHFYPDRYRRDPTVLAELDRP